MSRHDRHPPYPKPKSDDFQPVDQAEETRITSDMSTSEIEQRVRRRVEVRRQQKSSFIAHLISYIAVNAGLWVVYAFTFGDRSPSNLQNWSQFPWPLLVMFFWGIGVVTQAMHLYQNAPSVVARREQHVQAEVMRIKQQMGLPIDSANETYYDEKPKNAEKPKNTPQAMHLSTDGEIVPLETLLEDDSEASQPPRYTNTARGSATDR